MELIMELPILFMFRGADVYVAGSESNGTNVSFPKVWKNGVANSLTNGDNYATANSVYVSGADVYVAGFVERGPYETVAKVWINGVATLLTNLNESGAYSIYVSGTDVYTGGYEFNGSRYVAKVWKNGVATPLTTNDGNAISVFVK